MKNVFLGEVFVNNTLENISVKEEMSSNFFSRYLMRAIMAGILVAFGYIMIMAMDASFNNYFEVVGKIIGASLFSLTLAAIYYTKSELLTSNMMMISVAKYYNKITLRKLLQILIICYIGNLIGGLIIGALMATTDTITQPMEVAMSSYVTHKQSYIENAEYWMLFVKAIFANFFINIAMLMIYSQNVKSDFGKIIVMFFGVFTFVFLGFEHSIANTELFAIASMYSLINGIDIGFNLLYAIGNIIIVLIGNFIGGGLLIGYYYAYINDSRKYQKDN